MSPIINNDIKFWHSINEMHNGIKIKNVHNNIRSIIKTLSNMVVFIIKILNEISVHINII